MTLPTWNLGDLFRSEADPLLERSLQTALRRAKQFAQRYRGKVTSKLASAPALRRALEEYERIHLIAARAPSFASLRFAESSADPRRGAFLQEVRARYLEIDRELIFFYLELLQIPRRKLAALAGRRELANYRHYLKRIPEFQRHVLSEDQEKLLSDLSLTGSSAWVRLFNEELSRKRYEVKLPGKRVETLSSEQTLEFLYSAKRAERRAAAEAFTRGLKEEGRRLGFIFNILAENKATVDRYRKYPSPEESRHLDNEITQPMVDTMTAAVVGEYPTVQRYYRFKAKLLGLKRLEDYDRYAPVAAESAKVPYARAKQLVLSAFGEFSPELEALARQFFDRDWIDAADRPGKRGGAFCSFLTPDLHPFVLVNFAESYKEVFTLAHELGHGVHACLMREQTYLNFGTPLTIAETASIFAELLLFEQLKSSVKNRRELLPLYIRRIDGMFATVFRQISMYRFEQDLHKARRERGELSVEQIGDLWLGRQRELYGNSITLTENYRHWWSYIGHFVHTPFYVYAYAFGELLTLSLFRRYQDEGAPFVRKYLDFLRAGGSKTPAELLKPFGIDLNKPAFWKGGLAVLRESVDEAVSLAR